MNVCLNYGENVEVTVRICDICKERIATGKCPLCGRDVCKPDTQTFVIEMGLKWRGPAIEVYRENICAVCAKKLEQHSKEILTKLAEEIRPKVNEVLREFVNE